VFDRAAIVIEEGFNDLDPSSDIRAGVHIGWGRRHRFRGFARRRTFVFHG
jgi:hypothetical protein